MIRKAICFAGLCALFVALVAVQSCASDYDSSPNASRDSMSARYRISGRVVAELDSKKVGLKGIQVTMLPENGAVLPDGQKNVTQTDENGYFAVEILSGAINGDIFNLEFVDKAGVYEKQTIKQSIDDFNLENGDGYYQGEVTWPLKDFVVMALKDTGQEK